MTTKKNGLHKLSDCFGGLRRRASAIANGQNQKRFLMCVFATGLCLLAGVFSPRSVHAQVSSIEAPSPLSMADLMAISGSTAALAQLPSYLNRGMDEVRRSGLALPEGVFDRLSTAVTSVYDVEKTNPLAQATLQTLVDPDDLLSWSRFNASQVGRKVAKLEQERNGARNEAHLTAQAAILLGQLKGDTARFALIKEVAALSHAVDRALGMTVGLSTAVRWGALQTDATLSRGVSFSEVRLAAEAERDTLRLMLEPWVWASLAHAARDLPSDDLNQWVLHLKTPAAQRVYRDFGEALSRMVIERAELLAPLVAAAR